MTIDPWEHDQLDYKKIGLTFTNLVKSLDTGKVISIEAGFGRGKTFFRTAWSEHLRQQGKVVVEIDVLQSDHSGDPIVTLLGALVSHVEAKERGAGKKLLEAGKKFGAIGIRSVARAILKTGADEIIESMTEAAADKLGDFDKLEGVIAELGTEMSKVAGKMIASQIAAEKVRTQELPEQLNALKDALLKGTDNINVIIIVDELDRCHPEYAISFLESMKLIFSQTGFVFFLMANEGYLENLARHKFGKLADDERYLDKFVDIRLRIESKSDKFKSAVYEIAKDLPLGIPFAEGKEFSIERAAVLAQELASAYNISLRKTKRILLKVEVALRCYSDIPLDAPLLVLLAFREATDGRFGNDFLPRSFLTPEVGEARIRDLTRVDYVEPARERGLQARAEREIRETAPELLNLPRDRYRLPDNSDYYSWALVFEFLAPHYIPFHEDILNAVASISVKTDGE